MTGSRAGSSTEHSDSEETILRKTITFQRHRSLPTWEQLVDDARASPSYIIPTLRTNSRNGYVQPVSEHCTLRYYPNCWLVNQVDQGDGTPWERWILLSVKPWPNGAPNSSQLEPSYKIKSCIGAVTKRYRQVEAVAINHHSIVWAWQRSHVTTMRLGNSWLGLAEVAKR